jgi:pimeloyl-ACP methyl ester carboxylesterase
VLRLSGPSIFIADASVSDGSIALLYRNTAGTLLLAYSGRAGSGVVPLCDEARVAAARAYADAHRLGTIFQVPEQPLPALRSPAKERIESREISFSTYGARSGAFGTLLAHSARRRRGLVVYFHGGPSRSELDGAAGLPSAQLALTESDFLSVEYSGSSAGGPTLATALARRGPAALEEDAHAIARWVKAAGYRRIHVIGASFGSVPALAMLAQRQPGLASVSLVTPLLAYGSAEQVEARRDPHPGEWMKWRLEFDHRSFGGSVGDRRLATWLRLRSGALRDPRVRFYLAAKDPLVSPCDLPGSVPAERVAVFNATHQSISALPEFWARLAKDIAGSGATHHGLSRNMTHVSGTPARNSKLLQRCMSGGRDAAGKQRG